MLVNNTEQTHSLGAVMKCACLLILFAFGVDVYAQSYNASNSYRVGGYTQPTASSQQWGAYGGAMKSDYRVMGNAEALSTEYKAYQGTVYEPFNNTPPSEGGSGPRGISGRRNGNSWSGPGMGEGNGGEEGDDPNRDEGEPVDGPVGEPFVLLLFAALAAFFVARRQRQAA